MSNREHTEQRLVRLFRKRLNSGSGSAYLEFAFIAPLFLVCVLIIFDLLITLPRKQQLDVAARYYADALSFGASDVSIRMTFQAYQEKVPYLRDVKFKFKGELNQENHRYLVRGMDLAIDSLFEKLPGLLSFLGGALNALTLGVKEPYFDAFFKIDDCHRANVSMTAPALLGNNPDLVDVSNEAEKSLVTKQTITADCYMPTRNTGLGRAETYITKVSKLIRKMKPGNGG